MFDDERNEEELAVKSRRGDFAFWTLNLGMGPPLGVTRLAAQMGGEKNSLLILQNQRYLLDKLG